MAAFYLVRHGQASFGSDNYDQLSKLGYQQALWLGQHFAQQDVSFDRVLVGSMKRHEQTAQSICEGLQCDLSFETHAGFNEYDFQALVSAYLTMFPEQVPKPADIRKGYYRVLKQALKLWVSNELEGSLPESFDQFKQRVISAVDVIKQNNESQNTLVVSSGGAIAMAISAIMELNDQKMIDLNLQIKNSSFSQFFYNQHSMNLANFNCIPHLETVERKSSITFG